MNSAASDKNTPDHNPKIARSSVLGRTPASSPAHSSAAPADLTDTLAREGIFPYGSVEQHRLEERLGRYFSREYQRLHEQRLTLGDCGISSREGPMWELTDELMSQHYNESPAFFEAFLDRRYRAYTAAYYGESQAEALLSRRSLEQAQQAKFELICERARIQDNQRILNIGCGLGSLETHLLTRYRALEIVGMTPSRSQAAYLRSRMRDPGDPLSQGNFRLVPRAFDRETAEELGIGSFDLVCSIGLLEQVKNMESLFETISALLKPDGLTFHHLITSQMVIPRFLDASQTLIGRYFPGGRIWPFDEIASHTDHFELDNRWFLNGTNYWRTLDEWHRRFWDNIGGLIPLLGTKRIRHWNEYFSLCKACFAPFGGTLYGNGQYLFRKKREP